MKFTHLQMTYLFSEQVYKQTKFSALGAYFVSYTVSHNEVGNEKNKRADSRGLIVLHLIARF